MFEEGKIKSNFCTANATSAVKIKIKSVIGLSLFSHLSCLVLDTL